MRTCKPREAAFTIIELVFVIVLLSLLAATAVPKFWSIQDDATISAAQGARAALAEAVRQAYLASAVTNGGQPSFPADLNDVLASVQDDSLLNPWADPSVPVFDVDINGGPQKWNMNTKTIEGGARSGWGAIWYNPSNGAIRFRVPDQGSSSATLDLFHRVNGGMSP